MAVPDAYLDDSGRPDRLSGGVRLIPITTPSGDFRVWTKRVGNNPAIKLLLLHGGPGATHEGFEACDSFLPAAGIEYYYYDQLGSAYSDQPDDPDLWELDRFVDEVEQVRTALGLDATNFFLLGVSWGGILAMEYALRHGDALKGLVISNMMSSCPAYNAYAQNVLMPAMDQSALAEIKALEASGDTDNPRYMELLYQHHYVEHVLRMPVVDWPDPVARMMANINPAIYVLDAGPQRARAQRQARRLGPHRGAVADRGAHARDRGAPRHDGPRVHGGHGPPAPGRPLSPLPERQPPGDVRRPGDLLRGAHRLPARGWRQLVDGRGSARLTLQPGAWARGEWPSVSGRRC